ncbi:hypothetical protein [Pseudoalteromonas phenolica]|uniref:Uncharacterized protein n=1 Tax=Pseudoalteromonas phenolica TaxID=161398 RepID=A0A0S2K120_9GAMM|nr:hypothetical protein [Pseudoalteromonas phenolica]ALO41780.1 hypothetical protein PP2015_1266 [Pseudoalteromonas phenolica]
MIKQFPELQYEEVQKISYKLYLSVLDENETIDLEDDYYDLIEHVENDTEIHKLLITYDYFRYFIFKKVDWISASLSESYLKKAVERSSRYSVDAKFSDLNEVQKQKKSIIKEQRETLKLINGHFDNKVEIKKQNILGGFHLSFGELASLITFLSTLLLACGYFHISYLLAPYSINSGDFYSITDYLAVSSNLLDPIAFSVFLTLCFLLGVKTSFDRQIRSEIYSFEVQKSNQHIYLCIFISLTITFGFCVAPEQLAENSYLAISFNIFFIFLASIEKFPFKYLEKPYLVLAMYIFLGTLAISVFEHSAKQKELLLNDDFEGIYLAYVKGDKEQIAQKVALINSKFLFIKKGNEIDIMQLSEVKRIEVIKRHEERALDLYFRFFDWLKASLS